MGNYLQLTPRVISRILNKGFRKGVESISLRFHCFMVMYYLYFNSDDLEARTPAAFSRIEAQIPHMSLKSNFNSKMTCPSLPSVGSC